jgi:hypothetical protein
MRRTWIGESHGLLTSETGRTVISRLPVAHLEGRGAGVRNSSSSSRTSLSCCVGRWGRTAESQLHGPDVLLKLGRFPTQALPAES